MIKYIKFHLILFISVLSVFLFIFYLYQSQDVSILSLKDESSSLETKLQKLEKDIKHFKKEVVSNNNFLLSNNNLYIIKKPETLDSIKVKNTIQEYLDLYFENGSIKFDKKTKNLKANNYILYNAKLVFNYTTNYDFEKMINYFNNNFLINIEKITYSSKSRKFTIKLSFVGLKGKDIFSKKIKRKRRGR